METNQDSLNRARNGQSFANYSAIYAGMEAKGIASCDVKPRENVFTFDAWRALGRQVKKGEHGVTVHTWIPMSKKDDNGIAQPIGRKPRCSTVFHVSQTEARDGYSEGLWEYALKQERRDAEKPEYVESNPGHVTAEFTGYYSEQFTPVARG